MAKTRFSTLRESSMRFFKYRDIKRPLRHRVDEVSGTLQ